MATSPSFDPNDIDENYPELASAPDAPLINRATQSLYPPGSVFKVITAAAALEAGVSPEDEFFDSGAYELPGLHRPELPGQGLRGGDLHARRSPTRST